MSGPGVGFRFGRLLDSAVGGVTESETHWRALIRRLQVASLGHALGRHHRADRTNHTPSTLMKPDGFRPSSTALCPSENFPSSDVRLVTSTAHDTSARKCHDRNPDPCRVAKGLSFHSGASQPRSNGAPRIHWQHLQDQR